MNVAEAVKTVLAQIPDYPGRSGDGVVAFASEEKFFSGAYVLAKMLRHVGSKLPVQLWTYKNPTLPKCLAGLVEQRDLTDLPGIDSSQPPAWERCYYRSASVLHSSFRRVFVCDCDAYPVQNPDPCFDDTGEGGAVFWEDAPSEYLYPFKPEGFGLPPETLDTTFTVQGGAYFLDLEKCWKPYSLAHWMNCNGDHFNKYGCLDQGILRAAWEWCGMTPTRYSPKRVRVHRQLIFLNQYRDGESVGIVHRTGAKWGSKVWMPELPMEEEAWDYYDEYRRSAARERG